MILGYDENLGSAVLLDTVTEAPRFLGFNSITFGGSASDMVISDVWGQSLVTVGGSLGVVNTEYLDNYDASTIQWTDYTYLLALNENNLEGGSIKGLGGIESFTLYRYDDNARQASLLGSFDDGVHRYMDYTALLDVPYIYWLYVYGSNGTSLLSMSERVVPRYYGYFLIDVTNEVVYKFDTNFSGGDLQQNTDYNSFTTNNKYKTYHVGDLQYLSGNVAALVRYGSSDDYINNDIGLLNNLRDCIKDNNRIKILKTRKGEGWYVFTYDYQDSVINQAIGAQPINASFSFDEIGNLKDGINDSALKTVY